jgi:SH3-like domain-containing protein
MMMKFREFRNGIALTVLASAFAITSAFAGEYVSVVKEGVNLRSGSDTKSDILYQLPAGYPLEVLSRQGQWLKVSDYEGDKGWIQESLVNKSPHVIVKVKEGKVRSGPGTNEKIVGNVAREVIFSKVDQKGDWVKISHPDVTGWIHKDLVWP